MTDTVISGLFSLGGVIVGSLLSLGGIFISNSMSKKRQQIHDMCDQVAAYWVLEEYMAKYIEGAEGNLRAVKTIKEDFRSQVFEAKGIRPTMTEAEAIRFKKKV